MLTSKDINLEKKVKVNSEGFERLRDSNRNRTHYIVYLVLFGIDYNLKWYMKIFSFNQSIDTSFIGIITTFCLLFIQHLFSQMNRFMLRIRLSFKTIPRCFFKSRQEGIKNYCTCAQVCRQWVCFWRSHKVQMLHNCSLAPPSSSFLCPLRTAFKRMSLWRIIDYSMRYNFPTQNLLPAFLNF